MAKFILELNEHVWPQAKYLHRNEAREFILVDYLDLDKFNGFPVNSELKTEIINDLYGEPIKTLFKTTGQKYVAVNMVRVDQGSMTLSGKYSIYRAWVVAMHQTEDRLIWTPIR